LVSDLSASDCDFKENSAINYGGAIFSSSSPVALERCSFEANLVSYLRGGAIYLAGSQAEILECVFTGNAAPSGGALNLHNPSTRLAVRSTTFHENVAPGPGAVLHDDEGATVEFTRCIITSSIGGETIACNVGSSMTLECCDLWGNQGGDWVDCIADSHGDGNFSQDPLYCDPPGDLSLSPESPCLPGQHPNGIDCDLIGAFALGCSPTAVLDPVEDGSSLPAEDERNSRDVFLLGPVPNPSTEEFRYTISLQRPARVRVSVFDCTGRRAADLLDEEFLDGVQQKRFRVDSEGLGLLGGVYYLVLESGGARDSHPFVVLR
jgi:predicted outer membrane repeat protein